MTSYRSTPTIRQESPAGASRILIADDDPSIRQMLEALLTSVGYIVFSAPDGAALIQMAQEYVPDLLLIDLMMPQLDGFEAIRQLRHDTRTGHLPMLVLTARSRSDDLVQGFRAGADDFITKPFDITELLARIQANLSRAARQPVNNALTGLPGNMLLMNQLNYRLGRHDAFALLYADLDNFKVFNDTYGFARGDAAICMLAQVLQRATALHGAPEDFLGHIGGDDFAIVTTPERIEPICKAAIVLFDQQVSDLYEQDDLRRGYLSGLDRHGVLRRFPLLSLSIGVVSTRNRSFANHEEVSRVAAEMKHVAKSRSGSNYALDMRARQPGSIVPERRGAALFETILVSEDSTLRHVLHRVLQEQGYRVYEARTVLEVNALVARADQPPLLIADAQLGAALDELCRGRVPNQPLLVIAADEKPVLAHDPLVACLSQPLGVDELITMIDQLLGLAVDAAGLARGGI